MDPCRRSTPSRLPLSVSQFLGQISSSNMIFSSTSGIDVSSDFLLRILLSPCCLFKLFQLPHTRSVACMHLLQIASNDFWTTSHASSFPRLILQRIPARHLPHRPYRGPSNLCATAQTSGREVGGCQAGVPEDAGVGHHPAFVLALGIAPSRGAQGEWRLETLWRL